MWKLSKKLKNGLKNHTPYSIPNHSTFQKIINEFSVAHEMHFKHIFKIGGGGGGGGGGANSTFVG